MFEEKPRSILDGLPCFLSLLLLLFCFPSPFFLLLSFLTLFPAQSGSDSSRGKKSKEKNGEGREAGAPGQCWKSLRGIEHEGIWVGENKKEKKRKKNLLAENAFPKFTGCVENKRGMEKV